MSSCYVHVNGDKKWIFNYNRSWIIHGIICKYAYVDENNAFYQKLAVTMMKECFINLKLECLNGRCLPAYIIEAGLMKEFSSKQKLDRWKERCAHRKWDDERMLS